RVGRPPPCSTLLPYTTLFRSDLVGLVGGAILRPAQQHIAADRPLDPRLETSLPVEQRQGDAALRQRADQRRRNRGRAERNDRAQDRKSTRLNSSHVKISYAVF